VLELVGGETLAERIARGPAPVEEALNIAKQIAEALEAAHETQGDPMSLVSWQKGEFGVRRVINLFFGTDSIGKNRLITRQTPNFQSRENRCL
jgi:hypothetical protein